jgi:hypothetical protein
LFISAFRLCATKPTTASAKCFIPIAARSSHELGLAHDEKGVSCPIYIARKPDSAQQSMSHVLSNPCHSLPILGGMRRICATLRMEEDGVVVVAVPTSPTNRLSELLGRVSRDNKQA